MITRKHRNGRKQKYILNLMINRENIVTKAYHKNPKIIVAIVCCIIARKCTLAPSYDSQTSNPLYDLDQDKYRPKNLFPPLRGRISHDRNSLHDFLQPNLKLGKLRTNSLFRPTNSLWLYKLNWARIYMKFVGNNTGGRGWIGIYQPTTSWIS